jgi:hypothetical protein
MGCPRSSVTAGAGGARARLARAAAFKRAFFNR